MECNKVKHLEMIQNIIKRMANNSFLLKAWTVSLIVAIFTLADSKTNQTYFGVTYIPVVAFWFLDSYYLQMERKYIELYDIVRKKESVDFDLSVKSINFKNIKVEYLKYIKCVFSICEWIFYTPIIILLTVIFRNNIILILRDIFIR